MYSDAMELTKKSGLVVIQHPKKITAFLRCTGKEPAKRRVETLVSTIGAELMKHERALTPGNKILIQIHISEPAVKGKPC